MPRFGIEKLLIGGQSSAHLVHLKVLIGV
jgi:hypothetical protein